MMYNYKQKTLNYFLILNMFFYSHFASAIYVDWAPGLDIQFLGKIYVSNKTLTVPISVPVQFAMTKQSKMTSINYSVACYASFNEARQAGEMGGYQRNTRAMNLIGATVYSEASEMKTKSNLKSSVWLTANPVSTNLTFSNGFDDGNRIQYTYCIPIFPFASVNEEKTAIQSKGVTEVAMSIATEAVPSIAIAISTLHLGSCIAGDKSDSNTLKGDFTIYGQEPGYLTGLSQKLEATSTLPNDAYTEFRPGNSTSKGIDLLRQDYRFSGPLGRNTLYVNVPCPESAGSKLYTLTITYTIN